MSHAATPVSRFIGCDVGKTAIVVFDAASARTRSIVNEPQALSDFAASLDRRKAAALAGLAPHPKQSGDTEGYRRTRGGRPEVKRVLFMAALSARKHNPNLKAFYERLVQAGKKPLVAITAIMRNSSSSPTPNSEPPMPCK